MLSCLTADVRKKVYCTLLSLGLVAAVAIPATALGESDIEPVADQVSETVVDAEQAQGDTEELVVEGEQVEADEQAEAVVEEQAEPTATEEVKSDDALVAQEEVTLEPQEIKNGWYDLQGHKTTAASIPSGARWFENNVSVASKEVYDPDSDGWYWIEADGLAAYGKDVYISSDGGKWCRYGDNGKMVKGEDYRYGAWYLFDSINGAMQFGWKYLNSSGGKWVYYDPINGKMATGETYVGGSGGEGWCYFDENTGAMQTGWKYLNSSGGKWVYYNLINGRMCTGETYVEGDGGKGWCYFDENTGAMQTGWKYLKSSGGKWVYYDLVNGRMHFGETYVEGSGGKGWCYFDDKTGAMVTGWKHLSSNGGKWVYYDPINGRMHFGECYVTVSGANGGKGWCFFNTTTGALHYGWKKLSDGRTVYYNTSSGRMVFGTQVIDGKTYKFDEKTGALIGEVTPTNKVFWNVGGTYYHNSETCPTVTTWSNKRSGTVAQATAAGKLACPTCVGGGSNKVYWNPHGTNYHKTNQCPTIAAQYRSTMTNGTVAQAVAAGKTPCATCKP